MSIAKNKNVVPAMTSYCIKDEKHILIWDFDGIAIKDVIPALENIQNEHKLGDIVVLKTKNGYNALCLDKFDIHKAFEIKEETKHADKSHNKVGYMFDKWCMRIGDDKEYIITLHGKNDREKSLAHAQLIAKWLDLMLYGKKTDRNTLIEMETYLSEEHNAPVGVKY